MVAIILRFVVLPFCLDVFDKFFFLEEDDDDEEVGGGAKVGFLSLFFRYAVIFFILYWSIAFHFHFPNKTFDS